MTQPSRPSSSVKVFLLFALVLIGIVVILFTFLLISLQPVDSHNQNPVTFTIESGENLTTISHRLKAQSLIKNASAFKFAVVYQGIAQSIQAGNFLLAPSMSSFSIASTLTKSTADEVTVTLLEGWRREQYAEALTLAFAGHEKTFNPSDFLANTQDLEGYLFPDTYRLPPEATPQEIIQILSDNFTAKVTTPLQAQFSSSAYTTSQIIIMASIIEREARGDARPIVSGILWKRLENNWPLQADATLQYLKGYNSQQQAWWAEPLAEDKNIHSLFNTYQQPGLPPSPICNPSLSSIQAALSPESTEYWFYLTDTFGNMHYSTTYAQHLQNINTYLR